MKKIQLILIALVTALSVNAQVKVSSPFPNIEIKVRGCKLTGDMVTINLLVTNTDRSAILTLWTAGMLQENYVVDDEGNKYTGAKMSIGSSSNAMSNLFKSEFATDIPLKVQIDIEGIDTNASELKIVSFAIETDRARKTATLRNLPINKD